MVIRPKWDLIVPEVLPYSVNERLFTVSASENLEEPFSEAKLHTEDEPTQEHPRFVR